MNAIIYSLIGMLIISTLFFLSQDHNKKRRNIIGIIYASIVVLMLTYSFSSEIEKSCLFNKNSKKEINLNRRGR